MADPSLAAMAHFDEYVREANERDREHSPRRSEKPFGVGTIDGERNLQMLAVVTRNQRLLSDCMLAWKHATVLTKNRKTIEVEHSERKDKIQRLMNKLSSNTPGTAAASSRPKEREREGRGRETQDSRRERADTHQYGGRNDFNNSDANVLIGGIKMNLNIKEQSRRDGMEGLQGSRSDGMRGGSSSNPRSANIMRRESKGCSVSRDDAKGSSVYEDQSTLEYSDSGSEGDPRGRDAPIPHASSHTQSRNNSSSVYSASQHNTSPLRGTDREDREEGDLSFEAYGSDFETYSSDSDLEPDSPPPPLYQSPLYDNGGQGGKNFVKGGAGRQYGRHDNVGGPVEGTGRRNEATGSRVPPVDRGGVRSNGRMNAPTTRDGSAPIPPSFPSSYRPDSGVRQERERVPRGTPALPRDSRYTPRARLGTDPGPGSQPPSLRDREMKEKERRSEGGGSSVSNRQTASSATAPTRPPSNSNTNTTENNKQTNSHPALDVTNQRATLEVRAAERRVRVAALQRQAEERVSGKQREKESLLKQKDSEEAEGLEKLRREKRNEVALSRYKPAPTEESRNRQYQSLRRAEGFRRRQLLVRTFAPWGVLMDHARLDYIKAVTYSMDRILDRAWGAIVGYSTVQKTERARADYRKSSKATSFYRLGLCKRAWRLWTLHRSTLKAKALAISRHASKFTLCRRSFAAWRAALERMERGRARQMVAVAARGDRIIKKYFWSRWSGYVQEERIEWEVRNKTALTWRRVQGWIEEGDS